ncbi:MAG TPA: hypothetical protein VFJ82_21325 [Longimicrobium sp.]|nr:hypothetical protein [Longimicrobium sp.]
MKLRYFVLVTFVAATVAACANTPTAPSKPTRSSAELLTSENDTTTRSGGTYGSGH